MIFYIASLVLIAALVAAFLTASDRRDRRERAERAELLQRIQAPERAVAEHTARIAPVLAPAPAPMPMPIQSMHDDDDSYWQAHGGDLTREDLAELVAQHERAEGV